MTNKNAFYVIATPIGNLQEFSERAKQTISQIKYLFCEDTRVTKKLFNLLNIEFSHVLFESYHKFNEMQKISSFLEIISNNNCALMCDAGYPVISDPGQILIKTIRSKFPEHPIVIVNGPCAVTCALSGSGFPANNFYFDGFLPRSNHLLEQRLYELKNYKTTLIFYESVHRIINTLKSISKVFLNADLCVARELTKLNETYYFGSPEEIIDKITVKGEFVILINNNNLAVENSQKITWSEAACLVNELTKINVRLKDACKYIASKNNLESSQLYNWMIKNNSTDYEN